MNMKHLYYLPLELVKKALLRKSLNKIAIRNKICGVDIQHIGDAGYGGLADVNNIFALSVAIRGMRHTVARMASSVVR